MYLASQLAYNKNEEHLYSQVNVTSKNEFLKTQFMIGHSINAEECLFFYN